MKFYKIIIVLLLSTNSVFSQIDTTNWYPLQIGNKWQFSYYINISEDFYITIEVVGDTTINNKNYSILESWNGFTFQRVENNNFVYEFNPYTNQEYVKYDFISQDKSIWSLDSLSGQYGIYSTQRHYLSIYGDTVESKVYNSAYIDTSSTVPDTSWGPMVDGTSIAISKGIGITMYEQGYNQGTFKGAIINSDTLGVITSLSNNRNIYDKFNLDQNYPNPFNPNTTINFTIPRKENVELIVYNSLGQKVAVLLNKLMSKGNYRIDFDGSELSSGIYFYMLRINKFHIVKKMLLLK